MKYPKVTVVTATFNLVKAGRAETIVQAIQSVHDQKYDGEIEHLILDGASTDGTLEILAEFQEKGWVTIYSEKDRGLYDAMNKGIDKATGKYIVFLNSDDYWSRDCAVQRSVEALEAEHADFSFGKYRIEENGKVGRIRDHALGVFFIRMPFCHQTMFTRTDVLREFNGFDTARYRSAADYDLILRLILAGKKPVFVDEDFVVFRVGGVSIDLSLSEPEVIDSFHRHYGKLISFSQDDATLLFYHLSFSTQLFEKIKNIVSPIVAEYMKKESNTFHMENNIYIFEQLFHSSHLSTLSDEEFELALFEQQVSSGASFVKKNGSIHIKKNIFFHYATYKILYLLKKGMQKKLYKVKYKKEKSVISMLSKKNIRLFGLPVFSKYFGMNITSYHIFELPILTIIKR